ncbi:hypothetical protein GUITHDRAFT_155557 [Guillardia theta CCMP2712]|uniref:Uncharacterized protein n=2 Tax=Guillardia theta TaxID=55529 RepID=L1IFX2_GUITC|nr:hypothetical protein GUITHDRAFT_155557 [Guillardia theta CCMP2712]EKX35166.1 hypothetical protein GUITHDRAFT_155557 [Guillardia theta CCMP2712]|mmetsp:Transcript_26544/g.87190  ORF Transcript_26544/g.87190 Transcript_26544/m.87190 type:complete len:164 (+) Transcript_26544:53-544(+)|eukprot:XP_005822146.1 hypothetical protein GUITHDRAFT_155557 [Guillardia theta CCMP2712]
MERRAVLMAGMAAMAAVLLAITAMVATAQNRSSLLQVVVRRPALMRIPRGSKLYDAALEPLYTEGDNVISAYSWQDQHGSEYDPEAQNVYADLPMERDSIFDPDDEFRGLAPKDMSKSCDKFGSCEEPVNAWADLPDTEARSMSFRSPYVAPLNAWEDMTLDY